MTNNAVLLALMSAALFGLSPPPTSKLLLGSVGLGAARTGAYFSIAPFLGTAGAVLFLHEPITAQLIAAGLLMGLRVWLHLTEPSSRTHS